MKSLHEYATLEDAHAEVIEKKEIFSASTMGIYLGVCNLYLYLVDLNNGKLDVDGNHHPAKESVAQVNESFK